MLFALLISMASFGDLQPGIGEDESIGARVIARRRSQTGGDLQPGIGEDESIGARVTARRRSQTGASQTFSISGGGESPESRRVASKRVKTAAAELSKEIGLTAADSKSGKQAAKHSAQLNVNIWSQLDENLQAKIIAKLPFQKLFQVPSLSKTWMFNFHSDPLFLSDVCSSSAASWKSYSPVYVSQKKGLLVGYEGSSQRWCQLPPNSYLPSIHSFEWNLRAVDGSLFCWVLGPCFGHRLSSLLRLVIVANPLTKSWTLLPTQPNTTFPYFVHVVREENEAYKTILCSSINIDYRRRRATISVDVQIFDSTEGSWNVESYFAEERGYFEFPDCREGGSAVIHGVLYMLFYHWKDLSRSEFNFMLISLDLKTKIFNGTTLRQREFYARNMSRLSQLVVCRSNLMLVMKATDSKYEIAGGHLKRRKLSNGTLTIFWFDLEHMALIEVSQAPKKMLDKHCLQARYKGFGEVLTVAACNGDSIYISNHKPLQTSMCYNVMTQEWHSFSSAPAILSVDGGEYPTWDWEWCSITYQPGLDPFFEVKPLYISE